MDLRIGSKGFISPFGCENSLKKDELENILLQNKIYGIPRNRSAESKTYTQS